MRDPVVFVRRDGSIPCPMHSEVARTRRGRILSFYQKCAHLDGDFVALEEFSPSRGKEGRIPRLWLIAGPYDQGEQPRAVLGKKRAGDEYQRREDLLRTRA